MKSNLTEEIFDASVKKLDQADEKFYSDEISREDLKKEYKEHTNKFGLWEKYPYPYHVRGRNLLLQTEAYNEFYEKFDRQGVARTKRFFDYCKTAIYEFSSDLKEEAIRQEALIRLFAGLYYVIRYAIRISLFLGIGHLIAAAIYLSKLPLPIYGNLSTSIVIVVISIVVIYIFRRLKHEIIEHLRFARMKELNLIFDGYYLISRK